MSQITFYPIDGCYGEVYLESCKKFPLIVLNNEYLKLGIVHIIEILIHEMVHVYCAIYGINEMNFKNGYHNKNFKRVCEQIGMVCDKSENGFNVVTLPKDLYFHFTKFINDKELVQLISLYN